MVVCLRYWVVSILITLVAVPVSAQKKDYYSGYIVTSSGDTLEGRVKDRTSAPFMELYSSIRFKSQNSLFRKTYRPDEILGYGYGDLVYESIPIVEDAAFFRFRYYLDPNIRPSFLRVLHREGPLTYYHWEYLDEESDYLDFIPLFHRSGSWEMVRVTQGILGLKRKRLSEYFGDCPELVRGLNSRELNEIHEVYDFYLDHCAGNDLPGW